MKFLLLCAVFSAASATTYTIFTHTSNIKHSETDNIYLKMFLEGSQGNVMTGYFDNPDHDDFIKGAQDKFVFSGLADIGEIHCIRLEVGGDDWWMFDRVIVYSNTHTFPTVFENKTGKGLSSDTGEGLKVMRLCIEGDGDISKRSTRR